MLGELGKKFETKMRFEPTMFRDLLGYLQIKIKGVFSRLYCCYSNLLCHKINCNLFIDDWAVS